VTKTISGNYSKIKQVKIYTDYYDIAYGLEKYS